jgi:myosin heavy subunit
VKTTYYAQVESLIDNMKDYQSLKKKLKNRRLDYDAKQNKLHKSKKEKPEQEEEVRVAQAKYEKTLQQIQELMDSFSEKEEQLLESLAVYAEAEFSFYSRSAANLKSILQLVESRPKASAALDMPVKSINYSADSLQSRRSSEVFGDHEPSEVALESLRRANLKSEDGSSARKPDVLDLLPPQQENTKQTIQGPLASKVIKRVKALYSFNGESADELTLAKGDVVLVTEIIDEGWWIGNCNEKSGMFPSNYVEEVPLENGIVGAKKMELTASQSDTPSLYQNRSASVSRSSIGSRNGLEVKPASHSTGLGWTSRASSRNTSHEVDPH